MLKIKLEEQLAHLDVIEKKPVCDFNFKDIVSLFMHAMKKIGESDNLHADEYKKYYHLFTDDINRQNYGGWPKIFINRNNTKKIEINTVGNYIYSDNVLTLLLRIMYIENYKKNCFWKPHSTYKILDIIPERNDFFFIINYGEQYSNLSDMSLYDLTKLLLSCLKHYIGVHSDNTRSEHQIASTIISLLDV